MPSRCLNRVTLIGNLTRDPELRYTPGGMAVASFGIATNRVWVTKQGERKEDAQFHRVCKGWVDYPSSSDNPRQQEACDLLIESTAQVMKIIIDGWIDTMINEK